jgi:repressor LexA
MFTRDKERREKIIGFVRRHIEEHGFAPSVREIGRAVGVRSTKAVKYHLDILVEQGVIERTPGHARSLAFSAERRMSGQGPGISLPLVGRIAAGAPVLAVENVEDQVSLSQFRDCFLLRVQGQSMAGAGIMDGDLVIVRQRSDARPGEIVVALLGDEATVKRFQPEGGRIILMPENPDFSPIAVEPESPDFCIIGVVVGLLRTYR